MKKNSKQEKILCLCFRKLFTSLSKFSLTSRIQDGGKRLIFIHYLLTLHHMSKDYHYLMIKENQYVMCLMSFQIMSENTLALMMALLKKTSLKKFNYTESQ